MSQRDSLNPGSTGSQRASPLQALLAPRWRKVWRDLTAYPGRSLLTVLSIAVGIFAVCMILTTRVVLNREMAAGFAKIQPADAVLYTSAFDEDLLDALGKTRGVAQVEGWRTIGARFRGPEGQWREIELAAVADLSRMAVDVIRPISGTWPPEQDGLILERASREYVGLEAGQTLHIRMADGKEQDLEVQGLAHDQNRFSALMEGNAQAYVSLETLESLGAGRSFDELHLRVEGSREEEAVRAVAEEVGAKLERADGRVFFTWVRSPGEHPVDDLADPLMIILSVLGILSLALSALLIINTLSAILAQQMQQIGIMKALGASTGQVIGLYLGKVLAFGVLALLIAIPLGLLGGALLASYLAGLINVDIVDHSSAGWVLASVAGLGLALPLVAAIWPVTLGARISVQEALGSHGLGTTSYGEARIDRYLEKLRGLPRPILAALRNPWRRKGRLALTLTTLSLAGGIFVGVFCVQSGLLATLDQILDYWSYDFRLSFDRPERMDALLREAEALPGVVSAEAWGFRSANRLRPDGSDSDGLLLVAPPADTEMLIPQLAQGRWLLPDDENALVVNAELIDAEPDIQLGQRITLRMRDRESQWQVVGVVEGTRSGPRAYANLPYFSQIDRTVGRATNVRVLTGAHDARSQRLDAERLEQHFNDRGMVVSGSQTQTELRLGITEQFDILVALLLVMALILAIVGGLGLAATMSMNILERTREIGVMRAIGASRPMVFSSVLAEGLSIGLLSWLLGLFLALPINYGLSAAVGIAFLEGPLVYRYSLRGALLWLLVSVLVSALGSSAPAWRASRISVREALAYE